MREDSLHSEMVKVKDRRYFVDVYQKPERKLLTVKESRITYGKNYQQTIHVWENDAPAFLLALLRGLAQFDSQELLETVWTLAGKTPGSDIASEDRSECL